jgi:hypothetical protein
MENKKFYEDFAYELEYGPPKVPKYWRFVFSQNYFDYSIYRARKTWLEIQKFIMQKGKDKYTWAFDSLKPLTNPKYERKDTPAPFEIVSEYGLSKMVKRIEKVRSTGMVVETEDSNGFGSVYILPFETEDVLQKKFRKQLASQIQTQEALPAKIEEANAELEALTMSLKKFKEELESSVCKTTVLLENFL